MAKKRADEKALRDRVNANPELKAKYGDAWDKVAAARAALPAYNHERVVFESGLTGIHADAWMGFIVPAKTPEPIVRRLHDELAQILADPEVREKLKLQYMDVVANTPAEAKAVLASDVERWKPIIEKNKIALD